MSMHGPMMVRRHPNHSVLAVVPSGLVPLDSLPASSAAYSTRRLRTGYVANKAINVRRASDNAVLDVGFLANGDLDVPSLTTFLAATTGFIVTWYDQSGNGLDVTQPTPANQPTVIISETTFNNRTAMSFLTATSQFLARAATPSIAQPITASLVSARTGSFTTAQNIVASDSTAVTIFYQVNPNTIRANFGLSFNNTACSDLVAHAIAARANGVNACNIVVDGIIGSNTSGGTLGFTGIRIGIGNAGLLPLTGIVGEAVVFPSLLSNADTLSLQDSQKVYWGTP